MKTAIYDVCQATNVPYLPLKIWVTSHNPEDMAMGKPNGNPNRLCNNLAEVVAACKLHAKYYGYTHIVLLFAEPIEL
jgi:hypothetical protein